MLVPSPQATSASTKRTATATPSITGTPSAPCRSRARSAMPAQPSTIAPEPSSSSARRHSSRMTPARVRARVVELEHGQLGGPHPAAVALHAVGADQVLGDDPGAPQRGHDREAGGQHRGGVHRGLGDAEHGAARQLAGGQQAGVAEAGDRRGRRRPRPRPRGPPRAGRAGSSPRRGGPRSRPGPRARWRPRSRSPAPAAARAAAAMVAVMPAVVFGLVTLIRIRASRRQLARPGVYGFRLKVYTILLQGGRSRA